MGWEGDGAATGGCACCCCCCCGDDVEGTMDLFMPKGDDVDGRRETAVGGLGERFGGEEGT